MWRWLKWLHENQDGFLQWLVPLALFAIQSAQKSAAQAELEQAEQANIPMEESAIKEELALRGMLNTSASASQIGEPRRQYELTKKVRKASEVLGAGGINPLTILLQDLAKKLGSAI